MKLSLLTAAAALLITTAAAHADAGRIPSDLQGAWCKVAGNADLYKSGHCPNDIHVTTTGYTSASHSHAPRHDAGSCGRSCMTWAIVPRDLMAVSSCCNPAILVASSR